MQIVVVIIVMQWSEVLPEVIATLSSICGCYAILDSAVVWVRYLAMKSFLSLLGGPVLLVS